MCIYVYYIYMSARRSSAPESETGIFVWGFDYDFKKILIFKTSP